MKLKVLSLVALLGFAYGAYASTVSVPMYLMGKGQLQQVVGTVVLSDNVLRGLTIQPNLKNLNPVFTPGNHMVLVYNGSCTDALSSPLDSNAFVNLGPYSSLALNADGTMTTATHIRGVKVSDTLNQALVIRGGDNGQGYHIVCGMIPSQAKPMLGSNQ